MGHVLAAIFVAGLALLAAGALALQVLGLTGRLRRLEESREIEHGTRLRAPEGQRADERPPRRTPAADPT